MSATPEFVHFGANVAWLAFRTRCYDLVANRLSVAYMPSAARSRLAGFSAQFHDKKQNSPQTTDQFVRSYLDVLHNVYSHSLWHVNEATGIYIAPLTCSTLLPYIVRRAGGRRHVLEIAYELRESPGVTDLREHIAAIDEYCKQGDVSAVLDHTRELDRLTKLLRGRLGLDERRSVTMAISIAGLAQAETPIRVPRKISASAARVKIGRRRLIFLRNVFDELVHAASLGPIYDTFYGRDLPDGTWVPG